MKKTVFALLLFFLFALPLVSSSIFANEIELVAWNDLQDKDITPSAKAALSIQPDLWKHAETEHFTFHFTNENDAQTIYLHAETYYKWIKDLLDIKEDRWVNRNNIFIFSDPENWTRFKERIGYKYKGDAFTTGWELFIYRAPHWISPRKSLAHEITHVIIFRFLDGPLPLFLNEGFSEFVSMKAIAIQTDWNDYELRPVRLIPKKDYIALKELSMMTAYPENRIEIFYQESEILVRFFISMDKAEKTYELLRAVSRGEDFVKTVENIYGMDFDKFEEKFKAYATPKES